MKKISLKNVLRSIYRLLIGKPQTRYSFYYSQLIDKFFRYTPREEILRIAMLYASMCKLKGDYLEFGVQTGDSFMTAFHFAKQLDLKQMRFYAFDSFEGLPEITGVDAEGFQKFKKKGGNLLVVLKNS